MHKGSPPSFSDFEEKYGMYENGLQGAHDQAPTGEDLHRRAKTLKEDTSAGADGWRPYELRHLPIQA